jgi:hypothetical protein
VIVILSRHLVAANGCTTYVTEQVIDERSQRIPRDGFRSSICNIRIDPCHPPSAYTIVLMRSAPELLCPVEISLTR